MEINVVLVPGSQDVIFENGSKIAELKGPTNQVVSLAVQGPRGIPGQSGATGFTHHQMVPSDVWVINHGMGKNPAVSCVDSAGDEIEGGLKYPTLNQVVLTFSAATGGEAYLN